MRIFNRVVVFDAADIAAESAFWAAVLGGQVHEDDDWHRITVDGEWVAGVQLASNHVPPQWPTGAQQQQAHLDLHVDDLQEAARIAVAAGGREVVSPRAPADNPHGNELFSTFASPSGHLVDFGLHPGVRT